MALIKTKNYSSAPPLHHSDAPHRQSTNRVNPKGPRLRSPSLFLSLTLSLTLSLFSLAPSPLLALDSLSYKIGQMVMAGFYPGSNFEDTLY